MNLSFIIILLFGFVALSSCRDYGCTWTGCEGTLRSGYSVCQEYYYLYYSGRTDGSGCGLTSEKVECCSPTPARPGCVWSKTVWGVSISGSYACRSEFGEGYEPNDKLRIAFFDTAFECCTKQ